LAFARRIFENILAGHPKIPATKTDIGTKSNFKQFKVTFWPIGSKTA